MHRMWPRAEPVVRGGRSRADRPRSQTRRRARVPWTVGPARAEAEQPAPAAQPRGGTVWARPPALLAASLPGLAGARGRRRRVGSRSADLDPEIRIYQLLSRYFMRRPGCISPVCTGMAKPLTRAQRRRAVSLVVWLTANTPLAPPPYERELLARFAAGELALDQVEALLAGGIHRVLYHSRSVGRPTPADLRRLLRVSRPSPPAASRGCCFTARGATCSCWKGPKPPWRPSTPASAATRGTRAWQPWAGGRGRTGSRPGAWTRGTSRPGNSTRRCGPGRAGPRPGLPTRACGPCCRPSAKRATGTAETAFPRGGRPQRLSTV